MRLVILNTYDEVSEWAATYVKDRINNFKPGPNKLFVLGLPTGKEILIFCNIASQPFLIRWYSAWDVQETNRVST